MKEIRLTEERPDEEVDKLAGTFIDSSHYDILIDGTEDVDVYDPNGSPLIKFRCNVLPTNLCRAAFPALAEAAKQSQNRGMAAGILPADPALRHGERVKKAAPGYISATRARPLKKDGTVSNTNYAQQVESGIIGYFDRNARFPYCRTTAFTLQEIEKWNKVIPLIQSINEVFKKEAPDRYAAQLAEARKTAQDFIIKNTVFTTVTVNKDWRTAVHKDKGDFVNGFGVMTALRAGKYHGCYLVWPKFRVAVNMVNRCVCLANVHHWHGNTPLIGIKGSFTRISLVLYYRKNMIYCGSAAEEVERAANRKRGDKIN
jgi:hypothetical protein